MLRGYGRDASFSDVLCRIRMILLGLGLLVRILMRLLMRFGGMSRMLLRNRYLLVIGVMWA